MNIENIISQFENSEGWEHSIHNRDVVHNAPAIYAIVTSAPFQRLNSQSHVLYIGKTKCLGGTGDRNRLYGYRYHPKGHSSIIRKNVERVASLGHSISLKWNILDSEDKATALELEYLQLYMDEHLELPPFNRKL